jgi:hypothetical protein
MPYVNSYWGAVQKGQVFTASVTGGTTTVGTAATYTGLALTNPVGSGVKLAITHVGLGFLVAWPAAATVGIMTGKNASAVTQTTPVTPTGNRVNATALTNKGLAASAVTFPASPTLAIVLGAGLTGAITSFTYSLGGFIPLDEILVLDPGSYAAIYTSTVSGTGALAASLTWEEVSGF